ncbi:hypothetical protein ACFQ67_01775 [Streptomyces sp. NPDC056488]|uniref:hypothetical protein n=1 Tax=unclassified Streptomyces TaxID=2593676 RepID=UPI00367B693A
MYLGLLAFALLALLVLGVLMELRERSLGRTWDGQALCCMDIAVIVGLVWLFS